MKTKYDIINDRLIFHRLNYSNIDYNIKKAKELVYLEPNNLSYRNLLARLYIFNKEYYKAKNQYLEMIKLDETSPSAYYGLFKVDVFVNDDKKLLNDLDNYKYFHKNKRMYEVF